MSITFTPAELQLLTRLQRDLPQTLHPFADLGAEIGLAEEDVLATTSDLLARGIIREISGLFDTRALGYQSVLVAAECPPDQRDDAAAIVSAHPGVSHNYAREATFNLWFTLALPPDSCLGIDGTLRTLERMSGATRMVPLPALRTFKLSVQFDLAGAGGETGVTHLHGATELPSPDDIRLIRLLQLPMPIVTDPYRVWGEALGLAPADALATVGQLYARGYLRRLAAVLRHHKVGYVANAMGVWDVPAARVAEVGQAFAGWPAVSHCYERPRYADWPYNVFTMVHGRSPHECEAILAEMAAAVGLAGWRALYSTREYKKSRVRYYTDDLPRWEAEHGCASAA